ncbi:uncharacterized protein LAESUDRAFT_811331 [Laetiporus sulphureus 93-53]|uniref:Uncharacterized protein n=1 Tax=Laetiporus sulphureus 93-53 TaxID=1314785 RepID=A0A165FBS8_9APHY|nr:uncharacterized protein LAESUDRAFT_811331 [Laetiporus sulphureus 93-53]KZT08730.1 hypothetical protein LAESUDRAFT_811331 [Laetiporus sulphureus 93-53]
MFPSWPLDADPPLQDPGVGTQQSNDGSKPARLHRRPVDPFYCDSCKKEIMGEFKHHHDWRLHEHECEVTNVPGVAETLTVVRNEKTGRFHCPGCKLYSHSYAHCLRAHARKCMPIWMAHTSQHGAAAESSGQSVLVSTLQTVSDDAAKTRLLPVKKHDIPRSRRAQIRYFAQQGFPEWNIAEYMRIDDRTVARVLKNDMEDDLESDDEYFQVIDATGIDEFSIDTDHMKIEDGMLNAEGDSAQVHQGDLPEDVDMSDGAEEQEVEHVLYTSLSPTPASRSSSVEEPDRSPSPVPSLEWPENDDDMMVDSLPAENVALSPTKRETPPPPPLGMLSSTSLQQPTPPRSYPPQSPVIRPREGTQPVPKLETLGDPLFPPAPSRVTDGNTTSDQAFDGFDEPQGLPESNINAQALASMEFEHPVTLQVIGSNVPVVTHSIFAFLSPLGLTSLASAFFEFGCKTSEDLDVLCALGRLYSWQPFRKWLHKHHNVDTSRWYSLAAGFKEYAASRGADLGVVPQVRLETSQPSTAFRVAPGNENAQAMYAFLTGLRQPLGRHLGLFMACGLSTENALDRFCFKQESWGTKRDELIENGMTQLEWLVVREGLRRRLEAMSM